MSIKDMAVFELASGENLNEIYQYEMGRYISSNDTQLPDDSRATPHRDSSKRPPWKWSDLNSHNYAALQVLAVFDQLPFQHSPQVCVLDFLQFFAAFDQLPFQLSPQVLHS
ncbi:hypothetical protein AVEN_227007-1 [Araneus ventricosus]|uniref:Uncharacterized protein n=1 Tax=Araneus ventricosus TaxID=182803 RepID=A0A4Y2IXZ7_ARAVE|nr:hypothetical protein AVEN_227007-1 [Araneus ventricosus]